MKEDDVDSSNLDIPLAEMIQTLREELIRAQTQGANQQIRFQLDKVEMELKVVAKRTVTGHGGIEVWVVSAGGEYEKSGETSHTIKLTLNTLDKQTGEKIDVSAEMNEKPGRG